MTKLKVYKNRWDWDVADCPICGSPQRIDSAKHMRFSRMHRHIQAAAKAEAFAMALDADYKDIGHLTYYRNHTSSERIVVSEKRGFDQDLTV